MFSHHFRLQRIVHSRIALEHLSRQLFRPETLLLHSGPFSFQFQRSKMECSVFQVAEKEIKVINLKISCSETFAF